MWLPENLKLGLKEYIRMECTHFKYVRPRGEPPLELGVHVFGIMWNYVGIH